MPLVGLELCTSYMVRGMRYEVRGTRCEVRGTRYEVRGTQYKVWGTWYKVLLLGILTLIRMTKDEKGLAFFKGLLL